MKRGVVSEIDQGQTPLYIAQAIKSRPALLVPLVCIISMASFLLPRYQPYFFSFEHGHSDLRTRLLSQKLDTPFDGLVFVKITENELEQMTYRSPIDRAWIADLVTQVDALNPSAIGLDILIDQPTEPLKDQKLIDALNAANAPIILASVDSRFKLTDRQRLYNKNFIKKSNALSGFVNVPADEDDIVRELPVTKDDAHPISFADVVVTAATGKKLSPPTFKERIDWLKKPDNKQSAFSEPIAALVKAAPREINLTGKIALIGADIPGIDKHKTPFADEGRVKSGEAGTRILAHIIAQKLEGRHVKMLPDILEFILYILAALAGILIAANKGVLAKKARIFSYLGILAIAIDAISFK